MDSYLDLAKRVLERARRPLTPREILREAYRHDVAPDHLHGATQHKTLQARLSEHIIDYRDNALFFRTAPGKFFLTQFLNDETIPREFRQPIVARRRVRELRKKEVLAVPSGTLQSRPRDGDELSAHALDNPIKQHAYRYARDLSHREPDDIVVWSFVVVLREKEILTYRQGRYREDRDGFHRRRSIGFYAPVIKSDRSLFDQVDHGIVSSGLEMLATDLDLLGDPSWNEFADNAHLAGFVYAESGKNADLLGVVRIDCPKWFEPLTRRLAINDLSWHDLTIPSNYVEDYDPWSKIVLHLVERWAKESITDDGTNRAGSYRRIRSDLS